MTYSDISTSPRVFGIRPVDELPVDAEIWRLAHDHHHQHRFLHATSAHKAGVVLGLDVVPLPGDEPGVLVLPGIAIDAAGRTVILRSSRSLYFTEPENHYVVVQFRVATVPEAVIKVAGGDECYQFEEGAEATVIKDVPSGGYVELARIYRKAKEDRVSSARNPYDPAANELNLLHRPVAFPHCYADLGIGEISYVPTPRTDWKPNRAGLWHMVREANGRGFHVDFTGLYSLNQANQGQQPSVLYMAGTTGFEPLPSVELNTLSRFLDTGGTLVGESCGSREFEASFRGLMGHLKAKPAKVECGHPILTAHHVFSSSPRGAVDGGEVFADDARGVLFTTSNYGGAWQGIVPDPTASDSRERIRQAQEFGLNILASADRRKRLSEIATISGQ